MDQQSSSAHSATGTFNRAALDYFASHAISAEVAADLGVGLKRGELSYPCGNGAGTYERRRDLVSGKTFQPKGQPLELWWPTGRSSGAILLGEGESDCLAALTALRAADSPPPGVLDGLTVAAIPGCGVSRDRAGEELRDAGAEVVYLAMDGDDAGRKAADGIAEALGEVGIRALRVTLPDGTDLSDVLAGADDPTAALANLVAEAEATAEEAEEGEDPLILPSPSAPMDVARATIKQLDLGDRLRHWRGAWWEWRGPHWIEVEDRGVRSTLYKTTEPGSYLDAEGDLKDRKSVV